MENDPHYDSIICLLAVSVDNDRDNVDLCLEKELTPFITQIVTESDWKDQRYIPVLELIAALANEEVQLADNFADDLVHVALLGNIAKDMKKYKKHQSLFDDSSTETEEQKMLKYRTLAAEITTIGGLLQSHSSSDILSDPVIVDLIAVMGHQKPTDPYLLTAICTFAYDLMENEDVCFSEEVMRPFYENMADLKYLVPYIGFY